MSANPESPIEVSDAQLEELDALIIGAGVTGIYQLHCLQQAGIKAKIFEAGGGVGGTWYWNRYPGARFDSESWTYGYSFSKELLQEWDWKEHFSGQPENERYLNYVTDKFNLRDHIAFNERIKTAVFDERSNKWLVESESGHRIHTKYLIAAVGILSATHMPDIKGIESFQGKSFHTSRWPQERVNFEGKRVGVIGTGACAVQLIPHVAEECGHLTVFQRTPNYCAPLHNSEIDEDSQNDIKSRYPEIFKRCNETIAGFIHEPDPRSTFDLDHDEREHFYEDIWSQPGFKKWFGNFRDLMTDREANELYCEFVRKKIRERVDDPHVAEMLCPTDHHFGAKRIPLETNYYEAYNRENVQLVDVRSAPIEQITPKGIRTSKGDYEFDIIIYATGFDAITGELTRMDIRGTKNKSIREHWKDGPKNYMGLQTSGFPNLFIENGAVFCNFTRCAEVTAEFVSKCIVYMEDNGLSKIEASVEAEEEWGKHSNHLIRNMLTSDVNSWFFGTNVPGKSRTFLFYAGGGPAYRNKCDEVANNNYEGFDLS